MSCDTNSSSCQTPTGLRPDAPEPVRLRRALPADAAALALLGGATFLEAFTWMLPGADIVDFCARHHTAESYASYLGKPDTRITLAVTGFDVPIGYAMLTAPDLPTMQLQPGDFELKRIYVLSRFRSTELDGVRTGQALLNAAIDDALSLHGTRLLLGVNAGNEPAMKFYRKNGFLDVGTRTFQVGAERCCDLILGKSL